MITQAFCDGYRHDLLVGLHQPTDRYRLALYTSDAMLSRQTVLYTPRHEASGQGYALGGRDLTGFRVVQLGQTSVVDFAPLTWPLSTIVARGALVYNASRGDRALTVLDFGEDVESLNGPFTVTFPPATADEAVIRISAS